MLRQACKKLHQRQEQLRVTKLSVKAHNVVLKVWVAYDTLFGIIESKKSAIADHGWLPLNQAPLTSPELIAKKSTICYNSNNKDRVQRQRARSQVPPNSDTARELADIREFGRNSANH